MQRMLQQSSTCKKTRNGAGPSEFAKTQVRIPYDDGDKDEDEDEETLKLKLQAIEARLRLKRMQSQKLLKEQGRRTDIGYCKANDEHQTFPTKSVSGPSRDHVNVPRSPIRRPNCSPKHIQQSPSRVLGIDKGLLGRDVILTKPSVNAADWRQDSPSKPGGSSNSNNIYSRPEKFSLKDQNSSMNSKSFNARINERRRNEQEHRENRQKRSQLEALRQNRKAGFGINEGQLAEYKKAAASDKTANTGVVIEKQNFSRAHIMQVTQGDQKPISLSRKPESQYHESRQLSSSPRIPDGSGRLSQNTASAEKSFEPEDVSVFDPVSVTRLSKRILPHVVLAKSLRNKVVVDITNLLRHVRKPEWAIPESLVPDGNDFVIFGIVGSKTDPLDHKDTHRSTDRDSDMVKTSTELADDSWRNENRKYMVLTLVAPDLRWSVHLFLFSTAYSRWHNLKVGTLIAILNPGIMPPPPGRMDTNQWSLKIGSSEDIVLEVGTSRDMAWCHAFRQDGRACGQWIDGRRLAVCEFHAAREVDRARGARMETQGTGFSGGLPSKPGYSGHGGRKRGRDFYDDRNDNSSSNYEFQKRFDRWASSTYYMRADAGNRAESTARMLDTEDMSRRKDSISTADRTRKLFADREKEAEIAHQLGLRGTGAGAEYMKSQSQPRKDQTKRNSRAANIAAGHIANPSHLSSYMRTISPDTAKMDLISRTDLSKRRCLRKELANRAAGTGRQLCVDGEHASDDGSDELEIV